VAMANLVSWNRGRGAKIETHSVNINYFCSFDIISNEGHSQPLLLSKSGLMKSVTMGSTVGLDEKEIIEEGIDQCSNKI